MQKYIRNIIFFVASLLLFACSDDFNWEGRTVADDEYMIVFTTASPRIEEVLTRKSDSDREKVSNLTLLIFDGEGKLAKAPVSFTNGDGKMVLPNGSTNGSITVKKSEVADGEWWLVANAKDEIASVYTTKKVGTLKDVFLSAVEYGPSPKNKDQLNNSNDFVMVGHEDISVGVGTTGQENAKVFQLSTIYSRLSVFVGDAKVPFVMTGAKLSRYVPSGDLSLKGSCLVNNTTAATDANLVAPSPGKQIEGVSNKVADLNEEVGVFETYPYVPKVGTESAPVSNQEKMMLLVKGAFNTGTQKAPHYVAESWYAVILPTLKAGHHYKAKIISVSSNGSISAEEAEKVASGMSVEIVDENPSVNTIVTDGENVLAVPDSVSFGASNYLTQNLVIKARSSGTPEIQISLKEGSTGADWMSSLAGFDDIENTNNNWSAKEISSTLETQNGLYTSILTCSLTANENPGSDRASVYTVKLKGTSLERDVVFYQAANEHIELKKYLQSITLKISGSDEFDGTYDYFAMVNPKLKDETSTTEPTVKGIKPEANDGRVRNMGLHMPMPNGGVKYEYTITPNSNVKIDGGVQGRAAIYTFSDNETPSGGTDKYSYRVISDAIKIETGTNETYVKITLDYYHTGFFDCDDGNWYYYEVIKQGNDDLYWLDRNLQAESAGMGVLHGTTPLTSSTQPIVGDKAMMGGRFNLTEATQHCPKGWSVPSYAQMRSMTISSGFSTRRLYTSEGTPYYAPTFTFSASEDDAVKHYNTYFPANRMLYHNTVDGDDDTGYYLTTKGAGSENWYQTMVFQGMNVSSANVNYNNAKTSVRPCAGSYDPVSDGTTYTCNVKGYTHVFLYYLNEDNSKTYLTTWPGDQVAMHSDINRYHPFSITPTMAYDMDRLYVIFNLIKDDGSREDSNVSDRDVLARKGIKFVNKGSYTSESPHETSTGADQGHWDGSNTNWDNEEFRLKGNFDNSQKQWHTSPKSDYAFESKGNGLYELEVNVTSAGQSGEGQFVVAQKIFGWSTVNTDYKEWKHNVHDLGGTAITSGASNTMYSGKGDDHNWRFPETGTWKVSIQWSDTPTMTATKISGGGGGTTDVTYRIYWPYDSNYFMGLDLYGSTLGNSTTDWYSSVKKYESNSFNSSSEVTGFSASGIKNVKYGRYNSTPYAYMEFTREGGALTGTMKYNQVKSDGVTVNEKSIPLNSFQVVNGVKCYTIGTGGGNPGNADTWPTDKPYRMYWDSGGSSVTIWVWTYSDGSDVEAGSTFNGHDYPGGYGTSVGSDKYYKEYTLNKSAKSIGVKLNNTSEYNFNYSNDSQRGCMSDEGTYYQLKVNY